MGTASSISGKPNKLQLFPFPYLGYVMYITVRPKTPISFRRILSPRSRYAQYNQSIKTGVREYLMFPARKARRSPRPDEVPLRFPRSLKRLRGPRFSSMLRERRRERVNKNLTDAAVRG
jgi:branched-subunit amino acid aminotransferase/4-amino-4-deoxychorismate lyase